MKARSSEKLSLPILGMLAVKVKAPVFFLKNMMRIYNLLISFFDVKNQSVSQKLRTQNLSQLSGRMLQEPSKCYGIGESGSLGFDKVSMLGPCRNSLSHLIKLSVNN